MKKNKKRALKVPFYAHLLTQQEMQHAGGAGATKPSEDQVQTLKYPSDQEDTSTVADQPHTLKYPSDQEDVAAE